MIAAKINPQHTIEAALSFVAAQGRDTWLRMAMAIKSELGDTGFDLWHHWSQSADNYRAKDCKAVWKSIQAGGKVTIASLFHEAMQHGYQPTTPYMPPTPEQRARLDAEHKAAEAEAQRIKSQQRDIAKAKAADLWSKAGLVSASHPYLVAKGVTAEGAKQLRNMLVLPIRAGGDLVNLQLIGPDGSKRFLTGGQVKGTALVLGKLKNADEAILCEGWATGLSLHQATGHPVIVAWNAGNLTEIAKRLAQAMPDTALTVAGDTDASQMGQQAARKATQAHGKAHWTCPSFTAEQALQHQQNGHGEPSDFNDLHRLAGLAEVKRQIEGARTLNDAASESSTGYHLTDVALLRASDVTPEPVTWLWDGWLAAGKMHVFGGAPGTGKTTIAMGLAATVTTGGRWPDGTRTLAGNVVIWSGEDDPRDTLTPRLLASGADVSRVYFIGDVRDGDEKRAFDPAHDMAMLKHKLAEIGGARLMIVDPIVSAITGDSHKNAEVRRGLQPLVDLATSMQCALLGITHFSKGTGGRDPVERLTGSLAFGALARVVLVAAKHQEEGDDGQAKRLFCRAKSNIGPDDGGFEYDLHQAELADHPGIFASSVRWGEAVQGAARELLATADATGDDGDGGSLADAKRFLADLLADGPLPTKTLKADADGAGYSWATIRRAQKALGVQAERSGFGKGGGWVWELSNHHRCSRNIIDAQQNKVSTYGKFEHLCENGKPTSIDAQREHLCENDAVTPLENDAWLNEYEATEASMKPGEGAWEIAV